MSGEHVFCAVLAVDYFEKFARHARKRSRHAMPTCAVDRPFDRKGPVTTGEGLGVLSVVAEDMRFGSYSRACQMTGNPLPA